MYHALEKHSEHLFEIHDQPCREGIGYFIRQVIIYDAAPKYEMIFALLSEGLEKPWLFAEVCWWIHYWIPEGIPYLVNKPETTSLAFQLIMQIPVSRSLGAESLEVKNKLILDCFRLIVSAVSTQQIEERQQAKIIYQCLLRSTQKKFRTLNSSVGETVSNQKRNQLEMAGKIREIFMQAKLGGTVFTSNAKFQSPFYPKVLSELFELVSCYSVSDEEKNSFLDIPLVRLDLLAYLLELFNSLSVHDAHLVPGDLVSKIVSAFVKSYLDAMVVKELMVNDYFGDGKMKMKLSSWTPTRQHDLLIPWDEVLLAAQKEYLAEDFINCSSLVFSDATDKYDEPNRLVAKKLRTHLSILLESYRRLSVKKLAKNVQDHPIKQLLAILESKITSFISRYCVFEPAKHRFDLFNDHLERSIWQGADAELLPVIGTTISRFSRENKRAIIGSLVASNEIVRALKLLEFFIGEAERTQIIAEIKKHFRGDFFAGQYFTDLQYIISALADEEQFMPQVELSLAHAEQLVAKGRGGYNQEKDRVFLFRMRLLVAYYTKDLNSIDLVEEPDLKTHLVHEFSAANERDFYKALLYLDQKQPEQAYHLYNKLYTYERQERPVLALNRFASHLRWAETQDSGSERNKILSDALSEWMEFQNAVKPEIWKNVRHNVWRNKLFAFDALVDYVAFDGLYQELDPSLKMHPDFLDLRISNLVMRGMQSGAEQLLAEAQQFHRLENGTFPPFFDELNQLVSPEETISLLSNQYMRIFSRPPEILVQIVPDFINKRVTLPEFLLQELVNASDDMLRLINSISNIEYEDKFSDLLKLALGSRLVNYHWKVEGIRSGQSDKDGQSSNPGEVDFAIHSANGQVFAICEAFKLKGTNTFDTQKHVLKVLNYDPKRQVFYMIVYYEGKTHDFSKYWDKYCRVIKNFIEFPKGFAPTSKVEELKDYGNDSVRAGRSEHGPDTTFYHLFININYLLPLVNRKVKAAKVAKPAVKKVINKRKGV